MRMDKRVWSASVLWLWAASSCGGPAQSEAGLERALLRESPALTCTQGPMVSGIDVSEYQGSVDWAQVKTDGFQFAYAKATEGITYVDPQFQTNWTGMRSAGVIRGAYHFFHPDDDGASQADAYLAQVGTFAPGDLPPMLDWEVDDCASGESCPSTDASLSGCYAISTQVQSALDFIDEIYAQTGLTTVVYTYPYFWNCLDNPSQAAAYPLWQASYPSTASTSSATPPASTCPAVLAPWSDWTLWQWTSTGSIDGIETNPTDLDVFNGTLSDLQAFAVQASASGGGSGGGSGGSSGGSGSSGGGVQCPSGTTEVGGTCVTTSNGCNTGAPGAGILLLAAALVLLARAGVRRRRRV